MTAPGGPLGRARRLVPTADACVRRLLWLCAVTSALIAACLAAVLLGQLAVFVGEVRPLDVLSRTMWPQLWYDPLADLLPLAAGTLFVAAIALAVALPGGLLCALYLSEFAGHRIQRVARPLLEVSASVPTIVYGYMALLLVTPLLSRVAPDIQTFNALAPGLVMGLMILPLVARLSDDALTAVPERLRAGAHALGATRWQAAVGIVVPAASPGILAAVFVALARAMGETMIVAMAAGQAPRLTINPLVSIETLTTFVVQVRQDDVPMESAAYRTMLAAGVLLFISTSVVNLAGARARARARQGRTTP